VAARVKFSYERGGKDQVERPYLWLDLRVGDGPTLTVRGLFDTGADCSLLAADYAQALGLKPDDLEQAAAAGPTGEIVVMRTSKPVLASLPGATRTVVPLRPLFVPGGSEATWGRDFMAVYAVAFDERARQFSLFSPESEPTSRLDASWNLVST
jgi:hypothetical protein